MPSWHKFQAPRPCWAAPGVIKKSKVQCLVCLEEEGAVTRYMLPCKCKLTLCDACLSQVQACVYHRPVTTPMSTVVTHLHTVAAEQMMLQNSVTQTRSLLVCAACLWIVSVCVVTLLFLLKSTPAAMAVSALSVALALCLLVTMRPIRLRSFMYTHAFFHAWVAIMCVVYVYVNHE